ncbi:unnamed protein product [Ceutorhynchus assimilis]|uniref:AB hydrolase-1 domain-containing protein n=1 Tax=Ceutorhynchus assimilis TaxID=467358 RepID=A0A9N9QJD5_9CUCU|nr:unnamed protein product [Ceutorhynchus assimilis]
MYRNFSFIILFFSGFGLVYSKELANVCESYDGYFTDKNTNPECFYDPDLDANVEQRAVNHGLLAEKHYIRTEDSWILITFRLKNLNGTYGKGVVFLQHGLGTDATSFTGNGNKSIAFFLAKQGYDVWLGNFRGTDFSSSQNLQNKQFWDFSYHEHGLYDLPANFKYITAKTKSKIYYIGHSMGGSAIAVYFSTKPEEALTFVKYTTFLCATTYMRHTKGLLNFNIINNLYALLLNWIPQAVLTGLGFTNISGLESMCFASRENLRVCTRLNEYVAGSGVGYKMSPEKFLLAWRAIKNLGVKQMLHFAQTIHSRDFRMFDYGPRQNMIRYNSIIPPPYDLSKLPTNITLIYGANDYISTKEDTLYVFNKYGKRNWEVYEIPYNHVDHFYDYKYADKAFFPLLLKSINKHI